MAGQVALSYTNIHLMIVCAYTQKTDPPVPDTGLRVCHGRLPQIRDRALQSFIERRSACMSVSVIERERAAPVSALSCPASDSR